MLISLNLQANLFLIDSRRLFLHEYIDEQKAFTKQTRNQFQLNLRETSMVTWFET